MDKHHYNNKLIVPIQLACFFVSLVLGRLSGLLEENPQETVFKITDSLYITACILLAFKLARDGWEIPAAGFTLLTIAWGVFFQSLDFTHIVGPKLLESAFFFITPGYVLVAFYKEFPWWMKVLTLLCPLPFLMLLINIRSSANTDNINFTWLSIGFSFMHCLGFIWGVFFYIQYRREVKSIKAKMLAEVEQQPPISAIDSN